MKLGLLFQEVIIVALSEPVMKKCVQRLLAEDDDDVISGWH